MLKIYIYWHKCSCHACLRTDRHVKVEQYSAEAESAIEWEASKVMFPNKSGEVLGQVHESWIMTECLKSHRIMCAICVAMRDTFWDIRPIWNIQKHFNYQFVNLIIWSCPSGHILSYQHTDLELSGLILNSRDIFPRLVFMRPWPKIFRVIWALGLWEISIWKYLFCYWSLAH